MTGPTCLKNLGCAGAILGALVTLKGIDFVSHGNNPSHPYIILWPGLLLMAAGWVAHVLGARPPRSFADWAKLLVTVSVLVGLGYLFGRWCYYYPE